VSGNTAMTRKPAIGVVLIAVPISGAKSIQHVGQTSKTSESTARIRLNIYIALIANQSAPIVLTSTRIFRFIHAVSRLPSTSPRRESKKKRNRKLLLYMTYGGVILKCLLVQ